MDTPIVSKAEAIELGLNKYFTGIPCKKGHISHRYTKNGSCFGCTLENQFKRSRASDPRHYMVKNASYRARARGVPFDITYQDIVIPESCPCCNVRLIPKSERLVRMKTGAFDTPSLDRKVPHLGYVRGNIGILCMACNAKKAGIDEQMLKFLVDYLG